MTEDTEREWSMKRPVSAHLTIHYEDNEQARAGKVVRTVLNIEDQNVEQLEEGLQGSLRSYSLQEACRSPTATPEGSRRPSNAQSMNVHDFYQCVHQEGGSHSVARRYSEPRVPHEHPRHLHMESPGSPILRSMSYATGMDPHLVRLPPLRTARADEQAGYTGSRTSSRSSSKSSAGSDSPTEHQCLDLSCPCTRHHHRRNSVAVKFNRATYKKA